MIGFNIPQLTGNELTYIQEAVANFKISGNGVFTKRCHQLLEQRFGFQKSLLTTSCTDALEMSALLLNIKPGDEVIAPSFTFVSSVNAFALRGANIVFCDSSEKLPNIDAHALEELITPKTKVIVPVHYAGVACEMDTIMALAEKHNLFVVEDAAHAIAASYKGKQLGGIGHLGAFSFHETKNIQSGEGGALLINDKQFNHRSEILWEKGTNRAAFFRGEVEKYQWVDIGSSFLPSEITAAFLYAQLEELDNIQQRRLTIWQQYFEGLSGLEKEGKLQLPTLPAYATNNAHMFYVLAGDMEERDRLIDFLMDKGIQAVFHYLSLHKSAFYSDKHDGRSLPNSDNFSGRLLRLPMHLSLSSADVDYICAKLKEFYS